MINVQIIDNESQILPKLSGVGYSFSSYNDEVRALNAVEREQSSVILLNYSVRHDGTAEYIRLILTACPEKKIVVIADSLKEEKILTCLIAGAKGYHEISQLNEYAEKLIKVIDRGEAWITRRMVAILLDSLREDEA